MGKTQELGRRSENIACEYLQKQGMKMLMQNYRCRVGEIDLVMQDKVGLVFVEVRARQNNDFGGALGSVTRSKQMKLWRAGQCYLQQHKLYNSVQARFDVVAITGAGHPLHIEWIQNAFSF